MLVLPADEKCPKCYRVIRLSTIEAHPKDVRYVLHNFTCDVCGPVMTKTLSLEPPIKTVP